MIRKRIGMKLLLLLALFGGIALSTAIQPAKAQGGSWLRWLIDVNFISSTASPDDIQMNLIVQIGHTTQSGTRIIDDEHVEPVSCLTVGSPQVKNGRVTLDGASYFQCAVPSPKEIALAKWGITIPDQSAANLDPFVTGRGLLDVNSGATNPIFYRDDIQFGVTYDDAAQNSTLNVLFGQDSAASTSFPAPLTAPGRLMKGRFNRVGPNSFAPQFEAGPWTPAASPAIIANPIVISHLQSTVFVGYSPATGEYFEGTLGSLRIDPGCETSG